MTSPTRRRFQTWSLGLAVILALLHVVTFLGSGPFDDDFICYRYARNLLDGQGLVFNAGERIEGFSNPLWVLLLAAGMALGLQPISVSLVLSGLGVGAAVWAVGRAWYVRYPDARWPAPALLLALTPPLAWHGVSGLGTTFMAALLALWFLTWQRARQEARTPWAAGVFLALACLTRQEAVLFALPFAWAERHGRGRWAAALPLAALAAWTLFRIGYYGRLLPMPWYAKKLDLLSDWSYGVRYLLLATAQCGVGLLVLAGVGAHRGLEGASARVTRAAAMGVVLHALYVVHVGGDFMGPARFFIPVLPLAWLLACAALRERLENGRGSLALLVLAGIGLQWTQFDWRAKDDLDPPLHVLQTRPYLFLDHEHFEQRWQALGQHFRRVFPPRTSVALSPIGAFGYESGLEVVDILGLTNESSLGVLADLEGVAVKGHHRTNPSWLLDREPDVIVLGNGVGGDQVSINPWELCIWEHPRFSAAYRRARMPIPGGDPLHFWIRPPLPLPELAVYIH